MKRTNIFLKSLVIAATVFGIAGAISSPAAANDGFYAADNVVLVGGFSSKKHHFKKYGHSSKSYKYKKLHHSKKYGHGGFSNHKFSKKKAYKKKHFVFKY